MDVDIFDNFYRGKRVLITGHTGFKGSWLAIWLNQLGAHVIGVALDTESIHDNYHLSGIAHKIEDIRCDIRDGEKLKHIFTASQPDIIFHLAAQPLVRLSYECPVETYETNVMGSIAVMEAARATDSVRVIVMVTTDKCYENREQLWGYRENEPMGGYDPYSSSKGACELAIASWRNSFFNPKDYDKHHKAIASVRAGNVIGGGDWATDRIIPDCIKALEAGEKIGIRSPYSIRPWQHVLEPLSGYMRLAKRMWEAPTEFAEGWNFGPNADAVATVWEVASLVVKYYGEGELTDISDKKAVHEAKLLMLDVSKALYRLQWRPRLSIDEAVRLTVDWYRRYNSESAYEICTDHIRQFINIKG